MYCNLVQGEGFEPPKAEPDDLQSPVFDRFTIPALVCIVPACLQMCEPEMLGHNMEPPVGLEPTTDGLQNRCSTN